MKEKLKNIIHDLELATSFPPCEKLDQHIDDFFKRIQDLSPDSAVLDENKSDDGHIRHRQIIFQNPEEGVSVYVTVVQFSHPQVVVSPFFIIDADFGDVN